MERENKKRKRTRKKVPPVTGLSVVLRRRTQAQDGEDFRIRLGEFREHLERKAVNDRAAGKPGTTAQTRDKIINCIRRQLALCKKPEMLLLSSYHRNLSPSQKMERYAIGLLVKFYGP